MVLMRDSYSEFETAFSVSGLFPPGCSLRTPQGTEQEFGCFVPAKQGNSGGTGTGTRI